MSTPNKSALSAQVDLQPNLKAIKRALAERFDDARRDHVELETPERHQFFQPDEIEDAAQWAFEHNKYPANIAVSLASNVKVPYIKRGSYKLELALLHCAHADLNPPARKMTQREHNTWKDEAWDSFTTHLPDDLPDGFEVIDSGCGFTLIWPFTRALRATRENIVRVKDFNKRLAAAFGDHSRNAGYIGHTPCLVGTVRWPNTVRQMERSPGSPNRLTPSEVERGCVPALVTLERPAENSFSLESFGAIGRRQAKCA